MVAPLELSSNVTAQVDKTPNLGSESLRFNTLTSQTVAAKTHDAFTGSQAFVQTGAVQVTNAAANTVATIAIPDTSCVWIEACIYRQGGGATILTGVLGPATVETGAIAANWDATISVSGNNALVTFTNSAGGLTINVASTVRYQAVIGNT